VVGLSRRFFSLNQSNSKNTEQRKEKETTIAGGNKSPRGSDIDSHMDLRGHAAPCNLPCLALNGISRRKRRPPIDVDPSASHD